MHTFTSSTLLILNEMCNFAKFRMMTKVMGYLIFFFLATKQIPTFLLVTLLLLVTFLLFAGLARVPEARSQNNSASHGSTGSAKLHFCVCLLSLFLSVGCTPRTRCGHFGARSPRRRQESSRRPFFTHPSRPPGFGLRLSRSSPESFSVIE